MCCMDGSFVTSVSYAQCSETEKRELMMVSLTSSYSHKASCSVSAHLDSLGKSRPRLAVSSSLSTHHAL